MAINGGGSAGGTTTLTGLTDTPAGYGANGQVLTTNGVGATTWATASAGGFPGDPLASPDVGINGTAAFDLGTNVDMNTIDGGGNALTALTLQGGALRMRPPVTSVDYVSGAYLGAMPAGDFVAGARLVVAAEFDSSRYLRYGLACQVGTNPPGVMAGGFFNQTGDLNGADAVLYRNTGGRTSAGAGTSVAATLPNLGATPSFIDFWIKRSGNIVQVWWGQYTALRNIGSYDTGSAAAGVIFAGVGTLIGAPVVDACVLGYVAPGTLADIPRFPS